MELSEDLKPQIENWDRFVSTISEMDRRNNEDPNRADHMGKDVGYELFFAEVLFKRVLDLNPSASEELLLAARSQHICRWTSPRSSYPMDRVGYLKWRADLKIFHAKTAGEIMQAQGYDEASIARVSDLNQKKSLKKDPECQTLEDALCIVFLEKQFVKFSEKTDEEKMITILQKTWGKMSEAGHAAALKLPLGEAELALVQKALA